MRLPAFWCSISFSIALTQRFTSACQPLPPAQPAAGQPAPRGAGRAGAGRATRAPSSRSAVVSSAQNEASASNSVRSSNASCAGGVRGGAEGGRGWARWGAHLARGRRRALQPPLDRAERVVVVLHLLPLGAPAHDSRAGWGYTTHTSARTVAVGWLSARDGLLDGARRRSASDGGGGVVGGGRTHSRGPQPPHYSDLVLRVFAQR